MSQKGPTREASTGASAENPSADNGHLSCTEKQVRAAYFQKTLDTLDESPVRRDFLQEAFNKRAVFREKTTAAGSKFMRTGW